MDRSYGGASLEGWELLRLKGIPLRFHPTSLVLLLWLSAYVQRYLHISEPSLSIGISWCLGVFMALMVCLSVIFHELGHSFVALQEGVRVKGITIFLFGGITSFEREFSTPMSSLRGALAGPLVSLFVALVLLQGIQAWPDAIGPLFQKLIRSLGMWNLFLGLFNLLPGLPLDGGSILKALVWHWTGSQRKGTEVASSVGRFLCLLAICFGFYGLFKFRSIGLISFIFLGWFGLLVLQGQKQIYSLQNILIDLKVNQASGRQFRALEDDQPLRRLSQLRLLSSNKSNMPEWILLYRTGRWVGYFDEQTLKDLPVQYWDKHCLGEEKSPRRLTDVKRRNLFSELKNISQELELE